MVVLIVSESPTPACTFMHNSFAICGLTYFCRPLWQGECSQKSAKAQRAPNTPEFAQPRLSRVKGRSSPARGYKSGCVCSYMAGHYPGILMTCHIGTNTPKFVPPRWGRPPFDPTQTGLCKFWCVLELAESVKLCTKTACAHARKPFLLVFGSIQHTILPDSPENAGNS